MINQNDRYRRSINGIHAKEYYAYIDMLRRCENPNRKDYYHYGAIGRTVDPSWKGSDGWNNFMDHMGYAPSKEYSLERRDNEKGYGPDNCYWATLKDQNRNKSTTVRTVYKGRSIPLITLAEELDLPYSRLYYQVVKKGRDIYHAIRNVRNAVLVEQEIMQFVEQ